MYDNVVADPMPSQLTLDIIESTTGMTVGSANLTVSEVSASRTYDYPFRIALHVLTAGIYDLRVSVDRIPIGSTPLSVAAYPK